MCDAADHIITIFTYIIFPEFVCICTKKGLSIVDICIFMRGNGKSFFTLFLASKSLLCDSDGWWCSMVAWETFFAFMIFPRALKIFYDMSNKSIWEMSLTYIPENSKIRMAIDHNTNSFLLFSTLFHSAMRD